MAIKRSIMTPLAVAVALATTLSLSGCFSNPLEQLASAGADKLVEQATGGKLESSTGTVPKDFPKDVPLISDKVVHSMSIKTDEGTMWTVQVSADGSVDQVSESVQKKFEGAGWEQKLWNESSNARMGIYADEGRNLSATVNIMEADEGDGLLVQYGVIKSTESD